MRITMLMPNLPPMVCGIADHSLFLGEALNGLGSTVDYLALHGDGSALDESNMHLWDGSVKGLLAVIRQLSTDVLWVQYSGYGFSKKGMPFGLARALGSVRRSKNAPMVVVCMHETHASLARLGWWAPLLRRLQIAAAGALARAGDIVFATVETNLARCIDEYGVSGDTISLLPIASNIPVVQTQAADRVAFRRRLGLSGDARIAVIFGLWATQARTWELFSGELQASLRRGEIDHVIAVGGEACQPPTTALTAGQSGLNGHFTVFGPAARLEIARILRCCDIGLVSTPPEYLRKSGVAAAFAAANLELWMKNECAEVIVERNPVPFPSWEEVAIMANKKMLPKISRSESANR
jgi:hypothetical protein